MGIRQVLTESSLSRLWKHNEEHDCGAITAFRKAPDCGEGEPYTRKENNKRNQALMADLIKLGYKGSTKLVGSYPEGGKTQKEISYFVVDLDDKGNLLRDLKRLGEKYEQDSILFIPKGSIQGDAKAFLYGTNDCPNNWLGKGNREYWSKGKMGYDSKIYTSKVGGRPFIFEDVALYEGLGFSSGSNAMIAGKWAEEYEK
jgi:hypothetical protein